MFLGWDCLPKLFSEKIERLNRLICIKEIEVSSRSYHTEKQQGQVVLQNYIVVPMEYKLLNREKNVCIDFTKQE